MGAAKARFTKENGKITAERDMAYALTQMDPCIKGNG